MLLNTTELALDEKLDPLDLLSLLDSDDELESTEMLGPVLPPPEFEKPGPLD